MSNSVFNKGMVAGARPFEEKFQQQAEKLETFAQNIHQKLDDMSNLTDFIFDELNSMEKKRLYDLNTIVDIAELGEDEKELLLAVLYTLANMTEQINEYQQTFLRSVKNYLQITKGQTSVSLAAIENIENINDQKAILQTVMEFLFLQNASHSYMDEYSEVMDYFSVNKRGIKEIQECIDRIYKGTGLQGVAENYGYVPEEPKIEIHQEDFTKDYSSLEKQKITEKIIVAAGEVKTLEYLNLMFEDCIHVEEGGTLIIKNCYIKVKRTLDTAISSDSGEITMDGCVIDYYGLDGKQFFTLQNSKLMIQNTELLDCHRLITDTSSDSKIQMDYCTSDNLGIGITHNMRSNELLLNHCNFISSNDGSGDFYRFQIGSQCAFTARDLKVVNSSFSNFKYGVFEILFLMFRDDSDEAVQLINSDFINCNRAIVDDFSSKKFVISECHFDHCVDVFTGGSCGENEAICFISCRMENCKGLLGNGNSRFHLKETIINEGFMILQSKKQVKFENCVLSNWSLSKALPFLHAHGYSLNIAIEVGQNSIFTGCRFSNIDTIGSDKGISDYLIGGNSNGASILMDSCEFDNIMVNDAILRKVENYTLYTGTIFTRAKNKSAYTPVEIKNCQGIENTI
jgi:hypothetical protein